MPTKKKSLHARELLRQWMHIILGLLFIAVLGIGGLEGLRWFCLGLIVLGLVLVSLSNHKLFRFLHEILQRVQRKKESFPGEGAFFFVVGVSIAAWIFSNETNILGAIIALTFQDSFSTLIGIHWGKTSIAERKSLEGALGGFVMCFVALALIFSIPVALAASLVATLVELLPLNDSLTIPLATAIILHLLA
jgi:dolichol kinase